MYVIKRDGRQEPVHFDKITSRIARLCYGLDSFVDPVLVSQKVCMGVYKGVTTSELDELAAETAAHLTSLHPDFGQLAARIAVSNLHKSTLKSFTETCTILYNYVEPRTGKKAPMIDDQVYAFIQKHADELNSAIVYDRDFSYDYFGFKTLQHGYLLKVNGKVVERPQHMLMRVACGIHGSGDEGGNLANVLETYDLMSQKWFTHATPTLFNSGTRCPQLSSCFLLQAFDDSIEGIYDTLKACAMISKQAGGIGFSCHNIRASGSYIAGTNGTSNGLIPMLRVFNMTARYVDQGGGKRKGAFSAYLEPWHADILGFLDLKKNHGIEEERARDLFYGLWIPDLFMKRVEKDEDWALFCPNEAPGLADCFGDKFEELYESYEKAGKAKKIVKARTIWQAILEAQTETGTPYMLFKDAANKKSNQQNLGTIKCSNLCTEIIEYTSPDEIAVCNLASVALPMFVKTNTGGAPEFDFQKLYKVTYVMAKNLNRVIDVNYYPVPQAERSNKRHRPIGIGCQGLADAFILMRFPFDSMEAKELNKHIFETMYFAAATASKDLAKVQGHYPSFPGSPASKGIFQFDMWGVDKSFHSGRWDWESLREEVKTYGLRNSLLLAPMPTASTSQVLGNNECFEPYTSNIYVRRTLAGEFVCVSRHLLRDLISLGLWCPELKNKLIAHNGSVQHIPEIPADIKALYKTVWEISQKHIIDMAADRGVYIDQSQSLNIHMTNINFAKLTSMHFYAWKKGLKTGLYYLRSKPATDAIKFTVDPLLIKQQAEEAEQFQNLKRQSSAPVASTATSSKSLTPRASVTSALSFANAGMSQLKLNEKFDLPPIAPISAAAVAAEAPAVVADASSSKVDERSADEIRAEREKLKAEIECSLDNPEACLSCGS